MRWKPLCRAAHCRALLAGMQALLGRRRPRSVWFIGVGKGVELCAAQDIWPQVRMYAIDPFLREDIPARIHCGWRAAAWKHEGELSFAMRGDRSSTTTPDPTKYQWLTVPTITLDSLGLPRWPSVAFFDCETGGLAALEGGRSWLRNIAWLSCEMAYGKVPPLWPKAKEIHRFLRAEGFRLVLEIGRTRHRSGRPGGFDGLWCRWKGSKP